MLFLIIILPNQCARWSGRYEHFARLCRRGAIGSMPLYARACNATFSARLDTIVDCVARVAWWRLWRVRSVPARAFRAAWTFCPLKRAVWTFSPLETSGMNISPDSDAEAQLTACRSTRKHAMRLFPPVWTQSKGFSNRDLTILSMNITQKYLRYWVQIYCGCIGYWMKFNISHMTTSSPFTAVDFLDPIFHHSGTHFDRNVSNLALDVVFQVVWSCWHVGIDQWLDMAP